MAPPEIQYTAKHAKAAKYSVLSPVKRAEGTLQSKPKNANQPEFVTTTPNHPFYVTQRVDAQTNPQPRPKPQGHEDLNSNWVGAGHLKIGDKIKQADGTTGVVANVVTIGQTQEMFNLTVSEAHTFYVGNNGWLVHNQNSSCFTWLGVKSSGDIRATIAQKISGGHANVKHPDIFVGAIYPDEKAMIVQTVMEEAMSKGRILRYSDGRASFWNGSDTVIHFDPNSSDLGTIFQTKTGKGAQYWKSLFNHPNALPGKK